MAAMMRTILLLALAIVVGQLWLPTTAAAAFRHVNEDCASECNGADGITRYSWYGYADQQTTGQIIATISGGVFPWSGTITFKDGGVTLATSTVQYISLGPSNSFYGAIFNTNVLAVGSHSITAVYNGDVSNAPSTSAVLSQVISP